ncbi:MAG: hypothetical protein PHY34_02890 [Patescibacteria group bacterium]|nr:hypothetical protein [Patescibacteria group bacterium]MDD5715405.1 hypothetical protein [Patescibacteria group bacterium]
MTTYQQRQFELFEDMERGFKEGRAPSTLIDPVGDFAADPRRCLTGLVFIPSDISQAIGTSVIAPLQQADNRQYYYPLDSLHMTIRNVRLAADPPPFSGRDVEHARQAFYHATRKHQPFSIELHGLFQLPTSISIRGYSDEMLRDLVLDVRQALKQAGVPDDKKYASEDVFFGNVNVCRFTQQPSAQFFEAVRSLKDTAIGTVEIREIALVVTSPVCHPSVTKVIERFVLGA